MTTIDDLLARDTQREKDGFARRIHMGKIVKPSANGKVRFVVVPSVEEEKLYHGDIPKKQNEEPEGTGTGEGEEGDVIYEQPVKGQEGEGEGDDAGPGQGSGGEHEIETNAYLLGKELTEKFELPNLKEKSKKRAIDKVIYDLTDKNRGFGQFLDKKATLKKIIETNIALGRGNLPDISNIDTTDLIISPHDKIYRILSRERVYESQAIVFFIRDYSGSMSGVPTDLIVNQHIMLYSWLTFQYNRHVESRFILHDTDAKEVPDFYTYYNSKVAGGTYIHSGFELLNKIVEEESLARDYNIYVFHGSDGDDFETDGAKLKPELEKMLKYVNRAGITIVKRDNTPTAYETHLTSLMNSTVSNLLRINRLKHDADEKTLIDGIKHLIGI
jgi:uncharacterized sporulation protein YeaH/YhbH (DUF444 family)